MNIGKKYVDAYITKSDPKARPILRQLRRAIKTSAPQAVEGIRYGMPYYSYFGRLTYFAAFRNHVSLFVMGRAKITYAQEIKPYQTSLATLQFALGTKIPVSLIKKLIVARVKENDAAKKK